MQRERSRSGMSGTAPFSLRADMAAVLDREGAVCYNLVKGI